MQTLKSFLNQYISRGKFNHNGAKSALNVRPDMLKMLMDITHFLPSDSKLSQRCVCVLNGINSLPSCVICGLPTAYTSRGYNSTCGSRKCHMTFKNNNSAQTMRDNNTYKANGLKMQAHMKNLEFLKKFSVSISLALNTPDANGLLPKDKAAASLKQTLKNDPSIIKNREPKRRATMEQNGLWVPLSEQPAATAYRMKVHSCTMSQPLHLLQNFEKRGPSTSNPADDNWHIDHIYSVMDGFKNNIDPSIIGHITNLRMLHHSENVRKNSKSDITKEQLLERFAAYN